MSTVSRTLLAQRQETGPLRDRDNDALAGHTVMWVERHERFSESFVANSVDIFEQKFKANYSQL